MRHCYISKYSEEIKIGQFVVSAYIENELDPMDGFDDYPAVWTRVNVNIDDQKSEKLYLCLVDLAFADDGFDYDFDRMLEFDGDYFDFTETFGELENDILDAIHECIFDIENQSEKEFKEYLEYCINYTEGQD